MEIEFESKCQSLKIVIQVVHLVEMIHHHRHVIIQVQLVRLEIEIIHRFRPVVTAGSRAAAAAALIDRIRV